MARLLVALLDVQPTVWRVVRVPAMIPLDKLHEAIQAVMGWTDSHLHELVINGVRYGIDDPTGFEDERVVDERRVTLADALGSTVRTFDYVYDFGDNWHHAVTLEALEPTEGTAPLLYCLAGERACPPEDVGGPWAYEEFLEATFRRADSVAPAQTNHLRGWASLFSILASPLYRISNRGGFRFRPGYGTIEAFRAR